LRWGRAFRGQACGPPDPPTRRRTLVACDRCLREKRGSHSTPRENEQHSRQTLWSAASLNTFSPSDRRTAWLPGLRYAPGSRMRSPVSKCVPFAECPPNRRRVGTNDDGSRRNAQIQVALGKRFARPSMGNLGFEIVEFALIAQIKLVNEDCRVFVGVRIIGRIIHATVTQALR